MNPGYYVILKLVQTPNTTVYTFLRRLLYLEKKTMTAAKRLSHMVRNKIQKKNKYMRRESWLMKG